MNFSAVILAGGNSSRMGRDKAFLEFEGKTLLARQVELAREAGAKEIFISGRGDTDYGAFGCPVLRDFFLDAGPLAGIERALDASSTPMLLALAVDMPGMTVSTLQSMAVRCGEHVGVIPRVKERIEPLAAFYPKTSHRLVASLLANHVQAATRFAEQCVKDGLADFSEMAMNESACFANWNAQRDLTKAF